MADLVLWVHASDWTCVRPLGGPHHQWSLRMFTGCQSSPKLYRPMFMSTCSAPSEIKTLKQTTQGLFRVDTQRWYNRHSPTTNMHMKLSSRPTWQTHQLLKVSYCRTRHGPPAIPHQWRRWWHRFMVAIYKGPGPQLPQVRTRGTTSYATYIPWVEYPRFLGLKINYRGFLRNFSKSRFLQPGFQCFYPSFLLFSHDFRNAQKEHILLNKHVFLYH